jgi:hypothetical protein
LGRISRYADELRKAAFEASEEEAILVVVVQGDEWGAYGVRETFCSDGTRDGLRLARARVTESW